MSELSGGALLALRGASLAVLQGDLCGEAWLSRLVGAGSVLGGEEGTAQPWGADSQRGGSGLEERKACLGSIVRAGSRIWSGAEDDFLK